MSRDAVSPDLGSLVREYFSHRLVAQLNVSPRTSTSYRDAFRLLLTFMQQKLGRPPATLALTDLDAPAILSFLDHLERDRGNTPRTRNARLAAIHSFFQYAATRDPPNLPTIQRVLAIPTKRFEMVQVGFLTREEVDAVLRFPDATTWAGRRDQALFTTMYNTGARASEILGANTRDLTLGRHPCLFLHGKGRKERAVPLWRSTGRALAGWIRTLSEEPGRPLFPARGGGRMTRSALAQRLSLAVKGAATECSSLSKRNVSPHMLRHTTAMHLLQAGVDITVIALWLGHENPATTHHYVEADLAMKRRAISKIPQPKAKPPSFTPSDALLGFLESL